MNFAALFKVAVLLVATEVAQSQWTECSRTCGQGTRYKRCRGIHQKKCLLKYEDCTVKDCPDVKCCALSEMWKHHTTSECCKKVEPKSCGVVQIKAVSRRVVGGQVSADGQWPWMAALWRKIKIPKSTRLICGGALVNQKWVVTAAHCFDKLTAKDIMVMLGMSTQDGPNPHAQTSDIQEYIKHPLYGEWDHDIAVLKLKKSMRYTTHVHPICMPSSEEPEQDTICYVAGWGTTGGKKSSNELRHADLRVLPLDACKEAYRWDVSYVGITINTTCAGLLAGGKDSCGGDSGSPLVCQRKNSCQWYIAGVVAFGVAECGRENSPAVYTNVPRYEAWIMDQIIIAESHPCKSFPCQNGGTCIRLPRDEYICRCNRPHNGKNCERRLCTPNPCRNKGKCSTTPQGTFTCTCAPGYRGERCRLLSSCPLHQKRRYGSDTSCCNKASGETCGIESPSTKSEKIWPWLASLVLRSPGTLICAGTLIHKDWVLTAAHCFDHYSPRNTRILLGTSTIRTPASVHQRFDIASIIKHKSYDFPKNDIVLVKLSTSANVNNFVRPICLPSLEKTEVGATCLVAGYDYPLRPTGIPPNKATENFMNLIRLDICTSGYKTINDAIWSKVDQNSHLCVAKRDGTPEKYLCLPYMSGSPFMCQRCSSCGWYLVGLSELGTSKECTTVPDIYTNVYNFEGWIRQKISLPRTSTFSCP